jgi:hypothetical protein
LNPLRWDTISTLPHYDHRRRWGSTRPGVLRRSRAGRDLEQQVAAVYRSLSENERRQTAIIASNYGEAAAIDVYDRSDGLPALSGENQYFLLRNTRL